jgi:hypothetical protein
LFEDAVIAPPANVSAAAARPSAKSAFRFSMSPLPLELPANAGEA